MKRSLSFGFTLVAVCVLVALCFERVVPLRAQVDPEQDDQTIRIAETLGERVVIYQMGSSTHIIRHKKVSAIVWSPGGRSTVIFEGGTLQNKVSPKEYQQAVTRYEAYVNEHGKGPKLEIRQGPF